MKTVKVLYFFFTVIISAGLCSEQFSDFKAHLPTLFHLDDHDRCLLQKDSLYCLGTFDLTPIEPSSTYEYIKKYSSNPFTFNRSRLHRGYCVSARCPSREHNASQRFEQCVNKYARRYALKARLRTLNYCTTQEQQRARVQQTPDSAQQLFMQVVFAILTMNVIGTVYDLFTGDNKKKISLLMAWSVRSSWRQLTATNDNGDPRLKELESIQGLRVVVMLITMYAHVFVQHFQYYLTNPEIVENVSNRWDGILLSNGTALIQSFVMMTSFITAYSLLLYSQKQKLSFRMLPVLVIKRIIRIAPVHLLMVGFAATWWPETRNGALSSVIRENSAICRRKFWAHAFFINNLVDKHDICLTPTWYLPVDMHLYILSIALTIIMSRYRQKALRVYTTLTAISVVFCGIISYVYEWQAMIYLSVPENIRGVFRSTDSFGSFYTSTWGSLPACFIGLALAHLHLDLQEVKYDFNKHQWMRHLHNWIFPIGIAWIILVGSFLRHYKHSLVTATYLALHRPISCGFIFFKILGLINIHGPVRRFYGWRGWSIPAKLSLPVMLGHWMVIVLISARPVTFSTSLLDINIDYLATVFYSHVVALAVSLLLEIPVQRFFSQFISHK